MKDSATADRSTHKLMALLRAEFTGLGVPSGIELRHIGSKMELFAASPKQARCGKGNAVAPPQLDERSAMLAVDVDMVVVGISNHRDPRLVFFHCRV